MSTSHVRRFHTDFTDDERQDLYAVFADRQWIVNFLTVIVAGTFFVLTVGLLYDMNRRIAWSDLPQGFSIQPEFAIWLFFPFFGAMTLSFEITLRIWTLFSGKGLVNLYVEWAADQPKSYRGGEVYYDSRRVFGWLASLTAVPIGVFTVLALPMHATIGPVAIRDCGYAFKPCKVLPYADIKSITYIAPNDAVKPPGHAKLVLSFNSGAPWLSSEWGDQNHDVDSSIVHYLAAQAPVSITGIEAIEGSDPSANPQH